MSKVLKGNQNYTNAISGLSRLAITSKVARTEAFNKSMSFLVEGVKNRFESDISGTEVYKQVPRFGKDFRKSVNATTSQSLCTHMHEDRNVVALDPVNGLTNRLIDGIVAHLMTVLPNSGEIRKLVNGINKAEFNAQAAPLILTSSSQSSSFHSSIYTALAVGTRGELAEVLKENLPNHQISRVNTVGITNSQKENVINSVNDVLETDDFYLAIDMANQRIMNSFDTPLAPEADVLIAELSYQTNMYALDVQISHYRNNNIEDEVYINVRVPIIFIGGMGHFDYTLFVSQILPKSAHFLEFNRIFGKVAERIRDEYKLVYGINPFISTFIADAGVADISRQVLNRHVYDFLAVGGTYPMVSTNFTGRSTAKGSSALNYWSKNTSPEVALAIANSIKVTDLELAQSVSGKMATDLLNDKIDRVTNLFLKYSGLGTLPLLRMLSELCLDEHQSRLYVNSFYVQMIKIMEVYSYGNGYYHPLQRALQLYCPDEGSFSLNGKEVIQSLTTYYQQVLEPTCSRYVSKALVTTKGGDKIPKLIYSGKIGVSEALVSDLIFETRRYFCGKGEFISPNYSIIADVRIPKRN